ncbi:hypothetical protein MMC10_005491 [Thelotrema lepadinum]|nr:hypothetical protein [Thelotrema lepadinum]
MSPLPRRAIISVTSATAPLHEGHPTGLFISEALHPFNVFKAAGIETDLVSEKGTYGVDWLSEQPSFLPPDDKKQWEDLNGEFRQKLDNMITPAKVDASNYGIFFASAGHAALIDYPTATGLQNLAQTVWANGGIISAVCHGPALFAGVIDPATGENIVKGRTITGFTTEGEYDMHLMDILRSWGNPMIDEETEALGGKYVRSKGVWDSFHVSDGRLITGMNPQSAKELALVVVEAFDKL